MESKNYLQELQHLLEKAEQGDIDAMVDVGYMYSEGLGTNLDYQQAMQWYLKAANNGNAKAIETLKKLP